MDKWFKKDFSQELQAGDNTNNANTNEQLRKGKIDIFLWPYSTSLPATGLSNKYGDIISLASAKNTWSYPAGSLKYLHMLLFKMSFVLRIYFIVSYHLIVQIQHD